MENNESRFGKITFNKGQRIVGVWVIGIVERDGNKGLFLIHFVKEQKTL